LLWFVALALHERSKSVEQWWNDTDVGEQNNSEKKPLIYSLRPIYITHELTRYWGRVFLMRDRWRTLWNMARDCGSVLIFFFL